VPIPQITYIAATEKDIKQVVSLHMSTFKSNFTTLLGKAFLTQYYHLFLNNLFYFFIAKKEEQVIGFIVGVNDYKLLAKYLKQEIHKFIIPLLYSVLNIKLIPIISKRVLGFIFNGRANTLPLDLRNYNEITSFVVDKNSQGLGVGSSLLKHYLSQVNSSGILGAFITTDATENISTINFYKKNGFTIKHTYQQSEKRDMHLMLKEFTQ